MKKILVPLMLILMATVNAVISPTEMQTMQAKDGLELSIEVTEPVKLLGEIYLPPLGYQNITNETQQDQEAADVFLVEGPTFCDQWTEITAFQLVAYRDKKFDPGSCFGMEDYQYKGKHTHSKSSL